MNPMSKNIRISVSGTVASGKSTVMAIIAQALFGRGIECHFEDPDSENSETSDVQMKKEAALVSNNTVCTLREVQTYRERL